MREYKIRDGAVVEFRDGVEFREVAPDHQGYVAWLDAGNTPEVLPPLPGPTLEEMKAAAILAIRAAAQAYILRAYPEWKQCNIIRQGAGYAPADLETMSLFIDEARTISNQAETAVSAASTPEELEGIMQALREQYADDIPV